MLLCRESKELLLTDITISRNENEKCFIEPSVNSLRVSIRIKQADEIEEILTRSFARFLMQRAEQFIILRRKAIEVCLFVSVLAFVFVVVVVLWCYWCGLAVCV